MTQITNQRRYDIDALRSLAFFVLIFYHVGMYYVHDWGWHIKSDTTSIWLQEVMILTNPWRMSLLFFISGMVLSMAMRKVSIGNAIKLRTERLLIPLIFGMFVICAPQLYIEALAQQLIEPNFSQFWWQYINPTTELLADHQSPIGLLTWNHLWYLAYLWVYSLLLIPLVPAIRRLALSQFMQAINPLLFIVISVFGLLVVWFFLREEYPSTHALLDDWYNHGKYVWAFLLGMLFSLHQSCWQFVIRQRLRLLGLALICYSLIVADRQGVFQTLADQFETNVMVKLGYGLVLTANHWLWLFAAIGFAGAYFGPHRLNQSQTAEQDKSSSAPKWVEYCNQAILPWYILHQTFIIVFAWWMKPLDIPPTIEAILLISLTFIGCAIGYELVKRTCITRFLMGLKSR